MYIYYYSEKTIICNKVYRGKCILSEIYILQIFLGVMYIFLQSHKKLLPVFLNTLKCGENPAFWFMTCVCCQELISFSEFIEIKNTISRSIIVCFYLLSQYNILVIKRDNKDIEHLLCNKSMKYVTISEGSVFNSTSRCSIVVLYALRIHFLSSRED